MNGIVAQEREILARLNFPSNVTLFISPLGVLFFQYGGTSEPEDDDNFIDFQNVEFDRPGERSPE